MVMTSRVVSLITKGRSLVLWSVERAAGDRAGAEAGVPLVLDRLEDAHRRQDGRAGRPRRAALAHRGDEVVDDPRRVGLLVLGRERALARPQRAGQGVVEVRVAVG